MTEDRAIDLSSEILLGRSNRGSPENFKRRHSREPKEQGETDMTTLTTALNYNSSSPAIILPDSDCYLSYAALCSQISTLQSALAKIGVSPHCAVTISLINGLEFVISFLAVSAQRAIAAPLNPAYQQREVEFYVDDIKSALLIVPRGAVAKHAPAVRGARKFGAGIAEIWWDGKEMNLELKEKGTYLMPGQEVVKAHGDDIAVIRRLFVPDCSLCCTPAERRGVQKVSSSFRLRWTNCSCTIDTPKLDEDDDEYR